MIWVGLFLHLQDPQFGINKVTITNLSISSYSQISGDWEVEFIFRNHNTKVNLYYDQTEVDVSYMSDSIAQTILPPFMQNTKNETTIRATFTSLMMYVHDGDSIKDERSHGSITFNLRMMVRVQARVWWAGTWVLTVDCSKLKIAVSFRQEWWKWNSGRWFQEMHDIQRNRQRNRWNLKFLGLLVWSSRELPWSM